MGPRVRSRLAAKPPTPQLVSPLLMPLAPVMPSSLPVPLAFFRPAFKSVPLLLSLAAAPLR